MVTLVPQFTTDRMVKEYAKKYYTVKWAGSSGSVNLSA
jgi:hypothetical protein